jgi:hypothetical protein
MGCRKLVPAAGKRQWAAVSDPFDAVLHFDHTRAAADRGGPAHGDAQLSGTGRGASYFPIRRLIER